MAVVDRALTYYHDNPVEMRGVEHQREDGIQEQTVLTTDPDDLHGN